eukprot:symbB.v1.2.018649.t1/scaffold1450.1/size158887/9
MMAGITRIVFQELDEHPSFDRQREVVHATGADWHCLVPSRKRLAYLKAFQEHWAKNHLPRLRKIKLEPALDGPRSATCTEGKPATQRSTSEEQHLFATG